MLGAFGSAELSARESRGLITRLLGGTRVGGPPAMASKFSNESRSINRHICPIVGQSAMSIRDHGRALLALLGEALMPAFGYVSDSEGARRVVY